MWWRKSVPAEAGSPKDDVPLTDIGVVIDHNHGLIRGSLAEWIAKGPGIRSGLRPIEASRLSTGTPLPISVIPMKYRNTAHSRRLIALKLIDPPEWKPVSPTTADREKKP